MIYVQHDKRGYCQGRNSDSEDRKIICGYVEISVMKAYENPDYTNGARLERECWLDPHLCRG